MPEEIVGALSGTLAVLGKRDVALENVLDFSAYSRPQESQTLRCGDLLPRGRVPSGFRDSGRAMLRWFAKRTSSAKARSV